MRITRLHHDAAAVADGDAAFGLRALLIQRFCVRGLRFGEFKCNCKARYRRCDNMTLSRLMDYMMSHTLYYSILVIGSNILYHHLSDSTVLGLIA